MNGRKGGRERGCGRKMYVKECLEGNGRKGRCQKKRRRRMKMGRRRKSSRRRGRRRKERRRRRKGRRMR